MIYEKTEQLLSENKSIKTADVDKIAYQYIKEGVNVSSPLFAH